MFRTGSPDSFDFLVLQGETNASMEELNATFAAISQQAEDLKELAAGLDSEISFSKTGGK